MLCTGASSLFLARNDPLLNSFEEHLLLCNMGSIDWRALLNLRAVLEYLTKYTAKAGKGSSTFKKTFADVTQAVDDWEKDDGLKDLWRSAIVKFYSRLGRTRLFVTRDCSLRFALACDRFESRHRSFHQYFRLGCCETRTCHGCNQANGKSNFPQQAGNV